MRLAPIFTSHAVFASDIPIRIFGFGSGEAEVSFADVSRSVVSQGDRWELELPAMPCGGPYELRFSADGEETVLDDVFVGEVYLFAGQSNMQFRLSDSNSPEEEYESIPSLRIFRTYMPWDEVPSEWEPAESDSVGGWSALAYLAGREIAKKKGIAVGVITCHLGASVIESWVPQGTFAEAGIVLPDEGKHSDHFNPDYIAWNRDAYLYDNLLSKVIPFPINGAVWYQGESDSSEAEGEVYCAELAALIAKWRELFRCGDFPFAVVQIADHDPRGDRGWKLIQEAQAKIEREADGVKTVVSADVCESDDIHPPTKNKLAKRIADALIGMIK